MIPSDSSRQFSRLTYEALFARAAGLLGGAAANIMIARALGAEGKGILALLTVWSGLLAAFFSLGIHLAIVYELGARPWHARRFVSCVLPYVSIATLFVLVAGWMFRGNFAHPGLPLNYLIPLFSAQLFCNLSYALLIGLRNQSAVNWLLALGAVCYPVLVAIILMLRKSLDVTVIAVCMVVMTATTALVGYFVAYKESLGQLMPGEKALDWGYFLRYAIKSTVMSSGSLLCSQIVMLVFSAKGASAQIGVFSIAMVFVDTVLVIPMLIASFVLPRWAGLPKGEIAARACYVVRLIHPVSLVMAVSVALAATLIAGPVFGRDFSGAGVLVWLMVPGVWASTGITVISNYFLSQSHHTHPTAALWLGALLGGVLSWWWIPIWGGIGAALALSLSRLVVLLWMWGAFSRVIPETLQKLWIPDRNVYQTWGGVVIHSFNWILRRP